MTLSIVSVRDFILRYSDMFADSKYLNAAYCVLVYENDCLCDDIKSETVKLDTETDISDDFEYIGHGVFIYTGHLSETELHEFLIEYGYTVE